MLNLLLSLSSDAVLLFDEQGNIVQANPAAEIIFGYKSEELVGQPLEFLLPKRFQSGHKSLFEKFLSDGEEQRRMGKFRQLAGKRKDGTEFPLEAAIGQGKLDGKILAIVSMRDLSGNKVVQAQSDLFSGVLGAVGNLVLVSNSAGKIVYVSPSVNNLLGYDPGELLGDGWWETERVSGGDIEVERAYVMQAAAGLIAVDGNPYEHRLRHKDGSWRIFMLADAKGPTDLLIGVGTDITQLKHSEAALKESESRYRMAISAADAVPYSFDYSSNSYTFLGEEIERMTGFSRDELTPDKFRLLIQESTMGGKFAGMPAKDASILVRMGGSEDIWRCDYSILTKSGETRWLSDTSVSVKEVDGQFQGSIGILQDITSRKQVEMQLQNDLAERSRMAAVLRESEESIRALYDIASRQDLFENKLQAFLKMGARRFDLPVAQLSLIENDQFHVVAADTPDNSIHTGDSWDVKQTYGLETLRAGGPIACEHIGVSDWAGHPCYQAFKIEAYLGTPVLVAGKIYGTLSFASLQLRKRSFSDSDKDFINLMAQWVGAEIERVEASRRLLSYAAEIETKNKDLAEARDRALEASHLKSVFLATMSHEIRTPMNAILGMNELLLETQLDSEQREFASVVGASAKTLLTVLNDIIDFSKIEAGKIIINSKPFSPEKLAREVIELFHANAAQKGIGIRLTVAPIIPATLLGDPVRIRQVLTNLLSNAVKFTERGGIEVDLNGTVLSKKGFVLVTFTVKDSGIGISEATQDRLFEPFTQADYSLTRKYGGTGLGLAISRRLVDLMHGEVGLISREQEGSTFWFSLPLKSIRTAAEPQKNPNYAQSFQLFKNQRPVLVVDDDDISQGVLVYQLRSLGLSARQVATGAETINLVRENPGEFCLILMDVNMPDVDGLTATHRIREQETGTMRHIPIIAVTANAMRGDREIYLAAGMDDYLSKPVPMDKLGQVLGKWLK